MRKRKNEWLETEPEPEAAPSPWIERLGRLALLGGVLVLLGVAGLATVSWLSGRMSLVPVPTAAPAAAKVNREYVPIPPTAYSEPEREAVFSAALPAQIVALAAEDSTLWVIKQDIDKTSLPLDVAYRPGDQLSISPDGVRAAFVSATDPKVLHMLTRSDAPESESSVGSWIHSLRWAFEFPIRFWAWDAGGSAFEVATQTPESVNLYRATIAEKKAYRQLILDAISAPPVSDPATNRVLIAQPNPENNAETILFTISARCANHSECLSSKQEIVRVPFQVQWADYHPSATGLILASVQGDLYYLSLGDKALNRYILPRSAYQPMISPDGRYLGYIDLNRTLMLVDLKTDATYRMFAEDFLVTSFDWLP